MKNLKIIKNLKMFFKNKLGKKKWSLFDLLNMFFDFNLINIERKQFDQLVHCIRLFANQKPILRGIRINEE